MRSHAGMAKQTSGRHKSAPLVRPMAGWLVGINKISKYWLYIVLICRVCGLASKYQMESVSKMYWVTVILLCIQPVTKCNRTAIIGHRFHLMLGGEATCPED